MIPGKLKPVMFSLSRRNSMRFPTVFRQPLSNVPCICVYMYICIYVYMYMYMYVCVYIYIYICM